MLRGLLLAGVSCALAAAVEFRVVRSPGNPDLVAVVASRSLECGTEDTVFVYNFAARPRLLFDSLPPGPHAGTVHYVFASGDVLVITRLGAQCGSSWNRLSYEIFLGRRRIVFAHHDIWLGADQTPTVDIASDHITLRFRDASIDPVLHNREHVLRFRIAGSNAYRVDPVALKPRDFVDEWIARPWAEMRSRSAANLRRWHSPLSRRAPGGEFRSTRPCAQPGRWQVEFELPDRRLVYFLVTDRGDHAYTMDGVSFRASCSEKPSRAPGGP